MDRRTAEKLILRQGWLSEQDKAFQTAVLQRAKLVQHGAGDFVFHAGDEAGGICGVVAGGVGVYMPTGGGDMKLAHISRSGLWFGYGPLIRGRRRALTFNPVEDTWLLQVPLPALQELQRLSADHQRAIFSVSEYGMDTAILVIENLLIPNHAQRIAATLLRVLPPQEDDRMNETARIMLTQAQLAEMASVGRQVVNRALQSLGRKGLIASAYGSIVILDRKGLVAFAQND